MKEFRPPEEPALCADSSAGVPLVYSLTFSWSNRSIEMSFLAYITVIPATPSRRLVFRLRTRHIESPSGLRGIVYLLHLIRAVRHHAFLKQKKKVVQSYATFIQ